jgi:t-SNARE complex subunit (syntaxin)
MTARAKKLVKLLERLIKQDHLYSDEQLKQMKSQLRVVKQELADLELQTSKGFGKK